MRKAITALEMTICLAIVVGVVAYGWSGVAQLLA
jgi:hypothetical protein